MSNPMRISLCLCVLLVSHGICLAQKRGAPKSKKQQPQPIGVVATIAPGSSRQVGQAHLQYLADLDRTWAHVDLPEVYNLQNLRLSMTVRIDVPGRKVSTPKDVTFRIFYTEGAAAFAAPPELSVETDEGWLNLGAMRRDHEERFGMTGPRYKAVAKEIAFESFKRIAHSRRINVRVGNVEFQLKEEQGNALRDLLGTIGQQF